MLFKSEPSMADELSHEYFPPKKIIIKDGIDSPAAISKGGAFLHRQNVKNACKLNTGCTLLVDFGEEISGGVKLVFASCEGSEIKISFGESCAEALSLSQNDTPPSDGGCVRSTVLNAASFGSVEYGKIGFRFVCISALDAPIELVGLFARRDYRAVPWLGNFEASDRKLSEIWRAAARTVHLNMQELFFGEIKRERLVCIGEMYPAVKSALALFGTNDCIKSSLDFAKNTTPKNAWIDTYPSYSLWWVKIQHELYMQSGDVDHLKESIPSVLDILSRFANNIAKDGSVSGLDSFMGSALQENNSAKEAAFNSLIIMAFESGAYLCRALDEEDFLAVADRLELYVKRLRKQKFWTINKQAAAMQLLSGQKNPEDALSALANDTVHNISPFYAYFVLLALSKCAQTKPALDTLKKYWGAMLDLGASSFFEGFEFSETEGTLPPLKLDTPPAEGFKNIYSDGKAHPCGGYARSLCHLSSAGALAWIAEELLGVKILAPGCKKVAVNPKLCNLSWMHGTYPTPLGNIEISVTKTDGGPAVEITAPEGVEIVREENPPEEANQ